MTSACRETTRWNARGRAAGDAPLGLRRALECLPRDSLHYLCRMQGLSGGTTNASRRQALARAYRGALRRLLADLRRADLVRLVSGVWPQLRTGEGLPAGLGSRTKGELTRLLEELSRAPRAAAAEEWPVDEDATSAPPGEGDPAAAAAALRAGLSPRWSRPRTLARLLEDLGLPVPAQLADARFQGVLALLREAGVELSADDQQVAGGGTPAPGVKDRVRLRQRARESTPERAESVLPPLVVVPGPAGHARGPGPVDCASPYELAMLRLEFLTTVPSVDRPFQAEWPGAFLEAALRGLPLEAREQRLVQLAAATFLRGGHNPAASVAKLTRCLPPAGWDALLADYARLNPHLPEFVAAVVQSVRQQLNAPAAAAGGARSLGALGAMFRDG